MDAIKNFVKVEVSTGYDASATTVALKAGDGAKLPDPAVANYNLVWYNSSDYADPTDDPYVEIIRVTGRSTDNLTVVRPASGNSYNGETSANTAQTHNTGGKTYKFILAPTYRIFNDLNSLITTDPTDLKISVASKGGVFNGGFEIGTGSQSSTGWIGSENFGWYFVLSGTAVASFDNTISHYGNQSLKLYCSANNGSQWPQVNNGALGGAYYHRNFFSVKAGSTYRLSCWIKTAAITSGNGGGARVLIYQFDSVANDLGVYYGDSTYYTGTTDWQYITRVFTAHANAVGVFPAIDIGKETGTIWVDDVVLEEIAADTSFVSKVAEPVRPVLQAVTTTNNMDVSYTAGMDGPRVLGDNGSNQKFAQPFTPAKKYLTGISFKKNPNTGSPTFDVVVSIQTDNAGAPSGTVLAATNIAAATWNAFADNTFMAQIPLACLVTPGAVHWIVFTPSAQGTTSHCRNMLANSGAGSALRWGGASWATVSPGGTMGYIMYYAKKSETFSLVLNGVKTELRADNDGILSNAIIDLDNSKYYYSCYPTSAAASRALCNDMFSVTAGGGNTPDTCASGWSDNGGYPYISTNNGATDRNVVFKINTLVPAKHIRLAHKFGCNGDSVVKLQISPDGVTYTTIDTRSVAFAWNSSAATVVETDLIGYGNVIYVRFEKEAAVNDYFIFMGFAIEVDLNISSIPVGLFYPYETNRFVETVKLIDAAARIYFRLNKFNNEYGVPVPALEYTDSAGSYFGYTPLKIDNSQETNPAVAIVKASTTNGQASGTGSDEGTNYILNDGEYMTLSAAVSELSVTYLVGKGTTAFTNITKNILYLSSNGRAPDATQDPSHQGTFIVGVKQYGIMEALKSLRERIEYVKDNTTPVIPFGIDAGTTDDYAINIYGVTKYIPGMMVQFKAKTANTTGSTLNINGLGAKAIVKAVSTATASNDILAGMICTVVYDGTNFVLMNPRVL